MVSKNYRLLVKPMVRQVVLDRGISKAALLVQGHGVVSCWGTLGTQVCAVLEHRYRRRHGVVLPENRAFSTET